MHAPPNISTFISLQTWKSRLQRTSGYFCDRPSKVCLPGIQSSDILGVTHRLIDPWATQLVRVQRQKKLDADDLAEIST